MNRNVAVSRRSSEARAEPVRQRIIALLLAFLSTGCGLLILVFS